MSRLFSTTRRRLVQWVGYDKNLLPGVYKNATDIYSENGAVKKVGEIDKIEILHRHDGSSPVHQSSYNSKDKEWIVSARIFPADGRPPKTHHIFSDGTGTMRKGDIREYSTSSR